MKPKKRQSLFRILSLAVASCLVFTACTPASDPEGLFGTPSNPGVIREGSWDYDLSEVPYHYGNAYQGNFGATVCDYGEKVLFVANQNPTMVYTYDKRTGRVETFCKDALCPHDTEACVAFAISALDLYQGKVYGHRTVWIDDEYRDQYTELKNGRFKPVFTGMRYARFHQGDLYTSSYDDTFLKYPGGKPRNPVILKEDFHHLPGGFVDNYFYYSMDSTIQRFDLNAPDRVETLAEGVQFALRTDGEYLYYCDAETSYLMRCNLDGSDPISLTRIPIYAPSLNYDEEYLYFSGYDPTDRLSEVNYHLFRLKKDFTPQTEPELLANLGFRPVGIYVAHQFDSLFLQINRDLMSSFFYIIDKDGTDLRELVAPK